MTLTDFQTVLAHYRSADPKIHKVLKTVNLSDWFENRVVGDYFTSLCRDIVYQQLAGAAASTIYGRFEKLIDGTTPDHVLCVTPDELRAVGLSWAKVKYVRDLAEKVKSGEVILDNLQELDNESVIEELIKVNGIGCWTAEMFLIFTLEREDVFSYGDLGLKKGFIKLYGSLDNIEKVVDSWAPYRSYGAISLWHYLDSN